jgi:hypothetical protein
VLFLVGVLDEVEQTLSGLAGPRSDGVGDLGLLATEVLPQVGCRDRLFSEPEVLLGEAKSAAGLLACAGGVLQGPAVTHFLRPGAL